MSKQKHYTKTDIVNTTIGRLKILKERKVGGRALYDCVCSCGCTVEVPRRDLMLGRKKDCGCEPSKYQQRISKERDHALDIVQRISLIPSEDRTPAQRRSYEEALLFMAKYRKANASTEEDRKIVNIRKMSEAQERDNVLLSSGLDEIAEKLRAFGAQESLVKNVVKSKTRAAENRIYKRTIKYGL